MSLARLPLPPSVYDPRVFFILPPFIFCCPTSFLPAPSPYYPLLPPFSFPSPFSHPSSVMYIPTSLSSPPFPPTPTSSLSPLPYPLSLPYPLPFSFIATLSLQISYLPYISQERPEPFFMLAKELYPGNFKVRSEVKGQTTLSCRPYYAACFLVVAPLVVMSAAHPLPLLYPAPGRQGDAPAELHPSETTGLVPAHHLHMYIHTYVRRCTYTHALMNTMPHAHACSHAGKQACMHAHTSTPVVTATTYDRQTRVDGLQACNITINYFKAVVNSMHCTLCRTLTLWSGGQAFLLISSLKLTVASTMLTAWSATRNSPTSL